MESSAFQQKLAQAKKPIIVDFWAPWCVPCRVTNPVLERLSEEYSDRVDFLAVNADEAHDLLDHFRIIGIPTVLAFREGKVVGRVTGAQNESGYRTMFESVSNGEEVRIHLSAFDRGLRLTAGALLFVIGISTSSMLMLGIGGIVAFLGIYDRCPIWGAITRRLKKMGKN